MKLIRSRGNCFFSCFDDVHRPLFSDKWNFRNRFYSSPCAQSQGPMRVEETANFICVKGIENEISGTVLVLLQARIACFAAADGITTSPLTAGLLIASGSSRRAGTTPWAFVCVPQVVDRNQKPVKSRNKSVNNKRERKQTNN